MDRRSNCKETLCRVGAREGGRGAGPQAVEALAALTPTSCYWQFCETIRTDVTWMRWPPIDDAIAPELLPEPDPEPEVAPPAVEPLPAAPVPVSEPLPPEP